MAYSPTALKASALTDLLLRENRPERYEPDADWLVGVAQSVAVTLPEDESRLEWAKALVRKRESRATRRVNKLMRNFAESQQLGFDWWGYQYEPLAFTTVKVDDKGKQILVHQRVSLRAADSHDFSAFEKTEYSSAENDHKARLKTCDGARLISSLILSGGFLTWQDWVASEVGALD